MGTTVECQRNRLTAAHIVNSTATFTVVSTMTISVPLTHSVHSAQVEQARKADISQRLSQVTIFSSQTLPSICTCVVSFYSPTLSRPAATPNSTPNIQINRDSYSSVPNSKQRSRRCTQSHPAPLGGTQSAFAAHTRVSYRRPKECCRALHRWSYTSGAASTQTSRTCMQRSVQASPH